MLQIKEGLSFQYMEMPDAQRSTKSSSFRAQSTTPSIVQKPKVMAVPTSPLVISTMEPTVFGLYRQRTLTNSAAEYVETRAGKEVVAQIIDSDEFEEPDNMNTGSEFVPEFDRFVPKGVQVDLSKCYEESQRRMEKFQQTLHSFVRLLRERNVDKDLNVVIKDPGELTMQDALVIISKIQEGRDPKHVRSCKSFIQKCYRKAEDNRGAIGAILSMLPNDSYGSVISGGFALILAAVEKHAEHRQAMQKFLAEIPEQLEGIQGWSQLHLNSLRVHCQGDAVLVSIFVVLERIVHHLTQTWRDKMKDKAKGLFGSPKSKALTSKTDMKIAGAANEDTKTVTDVLRDLQIQADKFQKEIEFADSERLGRVELGNADLKHEMTVISKELRENRDELEKGRISIERFIQGGAFNKSERSQDELQRVIFNTLYQLHASHPMFDPRTGQVNYEELERLRLSKLVEAPRSFQKSNQAIVSSWLGKIQTNGFDHDPDDDIRDCLSQIETLDPDEKDQTQYIMSSPEMNTWLQAQKTTLLQLDLQTPPTNLSNALSFTCARLSVALRSIEKHPTLSFFSKHRNITSSSETKSGPVALIRYLNGQLLQFIAKHKSTLDLSQLSQSFLSKAANDTGNGLKLFRALLILLEKVKKEEEEEPDTAIFLILDSLSSLSGKPKESHAMIETLWNIILRREKLVVKLMVTDTLVNSPVKGMATLSLLVPDLVSMTGVMDGYGETRERVKARVEESTPKKSRPKGKSRELESGSEEED